MLKTCKTQIQGTLLELYKLVYDHNKELIKHITFALHHHFYSKSWIGQKEFSRCISVTEEKKLQGFKKMRKMLLCLKNVFGGDSISSILLFNCENTKVSPFKVLHESSKYEHVLFGSLRVKQKQFYLT